MNKPDYNAGEIIIAHTSEIIPYFNNEDEAK
jgi:hypothetical protein